MAFLIPEIYLIDGENLVNRFQAMQEGGHKPKPDIIHIPDVFVWSPSIMTAVTGDIGDVRRVSYYTSAVGDDERIAAIESQIRSFTYTCKGEKFSRINALFPRVFKKHGKTRRSRSVDINIVIDALRYTRAGTIGIVGLVSGDADFAPLVTELSHSGVAVHVQALSSGLSSTLERLADSFALLDDKLFEMPTPRPDPETVPPHP